MLALEVEYLMGRALATARNNRNAAEWPPHPARLFSALVSTLYEADLDADQQAAGRAALAWLEGLPAPALYADPPTAGHYGRAVLNAWTPVNPTQAEVGDSRNVPRSFLAEGLRLPRKRAERSFPAFAPHDPRVLFVWPQVEAGDLDHHGPALDRLAAELGYLGHSMSPVRARRLESLPDGLTPTLNPGPRGELSLRVPGPGRLARLEQCYQQGQKLGRAIEPPQGRYQAYAVVGAAGREASPRPLWDMAAVFRRMAGPRLPLEAGLSLAQAVRDNLLRVADQPPPAVLSGHTPDRQPLDRPHVAVVPLSYVGVPLFPAGSDPLQPDGLTVPLSWAGEHGDGSLKGVAVLVPRRLEPTERDAVELALYRLDSELLHLGNHGQWQVSRLSAQDRGRTLEALHPRTWTRASRFWASVTPVVFGHHPRAGNPKRDALAILSRACADIGLSAPERVSFGGIAAFRGAIRAQDYRQLRHHRAGKLLKGQFIAHVRLEFDRPVAGPMVLGRGRFFGLGLCRPLPEPKEEGR